MDHVWTNARKASDLSQGSFGFSGMAAAGIGVNGEFLWNASNPAIHSLYAGVTVGGGAAIGVGGSYTWTWDEK